MNRKEKNEKKSIISQFIDLENGRYSDDKIDLLYNLVQNRDKYNGRSKTKRSRPHRIKHIDGSFDRITETTHTLDASDNKIRIIKERIDYDDDKTWAPDRIVFKTAKDILNNIREVLNSDDLKR